MSLAKRWSLPVSVILLIALGLAGCGDTSPPPISGGELAAARTFPYYTVYWVGMSFAGDPITAADEVASYNPNVGESIYYGNCLRRGILSSGCLLPLKVTTLIYTPQSNVMLGAQRNLLLRGVPATSYDKGRAINLYSGQLVIEVHADSERNALAAARLLKPFNVGGSSSGPLPPPVYCPMLYGSEPPAVRSAMSSLPGNPCAREESALAQQEAIEGHARPRRR
jgi:hypothetical protein